jgi:hypothetical protein
MPDVEANTRQTDESLGGTHSYALETIRKMPGVDATPSSLMQTWLGLTLQWIDAG